MRDEGCGITCALMVAAIGAFLFGSYTGANVRGGALKREAVAAGVARFVADEKGDVTFEWLKPSAPPVPASSK